VQMRMQADCTDSRRAETQHERTQEKARAARSCWKPRPSRRRMAWAAFATRGQPAGELSARQRNVWVRAEVGLLAETRWMQGTVQEKKTRVMKVRQGARREERGRGGGKTDGRRTWSRCRRHAAPAGRPCATRLSAFPVNDVRSHFVHPLQPRV
jgi:hypothetical protein